MPPINTAGLDEEDRAFVAAMEGLFERAEAMRIMFPAGMKQSAFETIQRTIVALAAAATTPFTTEER